jgi:hypothetical protein
MAHNKSSPGIVTGPLPDPDGLWLDLVFQMNTLNGAMRQFGAMIDGNPASHVGQNPPSRSGGAFGPEVITAMCEALEAACEELGDDITQREVAREVLSRRIIAAAKLGECDPVRLQAAALRKPN